MARDPQAALVALNRFGFGARGGASGDFVNAASDPRGFVKAELTVPTALLEVPGLQSTPELARRCSPTRTRSRKRARRPRSGADAAEPAPPAQDAESATRNSLTAASRDGRADRR